MSSVNKVLLIGNLGADPECRKTNDGKLIINLRIATSESWRAAISESCREVADALNKERSYAGS